MKSVVVTPTCHRPEFLALCLERLSGVVGCPPIHVFMDQQGASPEKVRDAQFAFDHYAPPNSEFHIQPCGHARATSGTWNILDSIRQGYETGAEYVYLVEEDVMVYPNWLSWHESTMATGEYLATCGRKDPWFWRKHPEVYCNPGSCLRRDLVAEVVSHINPEYFKDPAAYLSNHLGGVISSSLDDGVIRCCIRKLGGKAGHADPPVCAHQGFDMYDSIDRYENRGTIEERIARLRTMLATIKRSDRYARDFEEYRPGVSFDIALNR